MYAKIPISDSHPPHHNTLPLESDPFGDFGYSHEPILKICERLLRCDVLDFCTEFYAQRHTIFSLEVKLYNRGGEGGGVRYGKLALVYIDRHMGLRAKIYYYSSKKMYSASHRTVFCNLSPWWCPRMCPTCFVSCVTFRSKNSSRPCSLRPLSSRAMRTLYHQKQRVKENR